MFVDNVPDSANRRRGGIRLSQHPGDLVGDFEEVMSRFQRVMQRKSVNHSLGLTASQGFILRYLSKTENVKASDIARISGLSPGAVTQVCDELVREGLVTRTRSETDRRVVHIRITDQGRALVDKMKEIRREELKTIFTKLGSEDTKNFVRIVRRVVDIVEEDLAKRSGCE